jgi:phosphate transport system substrate-binding protein
MPGRRGFSTGRSNTVQRASGGSNAMMLRIVVAVLAAGLFTAPSARAFDQNLPNYQPVPDLSGQIKSIGSDTLKNEMAAWAKAFMALYPNVKVDIEAQGSATAPPALLSGASQFGPMSRPMSAAELQESEAKYHYKPTSFRVAIDALAVYVNKENTVACLSLPQLNEIFSSTRLVTDGNDITRWGQVGGSGKWATQPIALYGRNDLSGTYEFFREQVLYGGDYKKQLKAQADSEAVVQAITTDVAGIGYSGIGYRTEGVRAVPLSSNNGAQCYDTSAEATLSGRYPIAHYLNIYLNKKPDEALDPLQREFVKFILSRDGQALTESGGFYAITSKIREDDLRKLGIVTVAN